MKKRDDPDGTHLTGKLLNELTAKHDDERPSLFIFFLFEFLEWSFYALLIYVVITIAIALWEKLVSLF